MGYAIIILYNILLYTLYISTEPMCIIIAFNYAGSRRDNGKLLIGTFPNESDDGESRVYKLIYASTRYAHATDLSPQQYNILYYSYFDIEIVSEKPYGIYAHKCECPFVNRIHIICHARINIILRPK